MDEILDFLYSPSGIGGLSTGAVILIGFSTIGFIKNARKNEKKMNAEKSKKRDAARQDFARNSKLRQMHVLKRI